MSPLIRRCVIGVLTLASLISSGCSDAKYKGVVRPVPNLRELDSTLVEFKDASVEKYLRSTPHLSFPAVLAVAKFDRNFNRFADAGGYRLVNVVGAEAEGWEKLTAPPAADVSPAISQVQFLSPLIAGTRPDLAQLRTAAAKLHAPLLLVYTQECASDEGYNDAAIAYWTIVGLFCVPGNSVGHHTVCQAVLIDTRTGLYVSTAQSDERREEQVFAGAVRIARDRVEKQSKAAAVNKLLAEVRQAIDSAAGHAVAQAR